MVDKDCVFCKIAAGDIPAKFVHEDERALAFADLNPQAPTHLLVIPRHHYANVVEAAAADPALIGHLFTVINRLVEQAGLKENGFRVVCNTGPGGGQTVPHLHFHVLGGRFMGWPPG